MADIGLIESELGGLEGNTKRGLVSAFRYLLNNITFGAPTEKRAKNFQLYWLSGTTSTTANAEFSIAHGMDHAPVIALPVLSLNDVGSKLVPLEVSRASDGKRVYLKSSSTNAVITLLVE